MEDYRSFLKKKKFTVTSSGFTSEEVNPNLFQWQTDIVHWALRKGKAAIFADCGLGKTAIQLQWAKEVSEKTQMPVVIFAPLAVAKQTKREGEKFGICVTVCRTQKDVCDGVNITNYEMMEHFDAESFGGVVLDESSILKHSDSKTRNYVQEKFERTQYKLCCTATPAPNDFMELGTHAQFLGVMKQTEMLATFFVHDGGDTSHWRLKKHAESSFFEWVAGWACCMRRPQDLGYDQDGYDLPELRIHEVIVASEVMETEEGQQMFIAPTGQTLNERRQARRCSIADRVAKAAEIANATDEQVLVWCDLNAESEMLTSAINEATEVTGSMLNEKKEERIVGFLEGGNRVLVSKPSIAGWGVNAQNCHIVIFVGLSDSFESYYQAVRRCWRYGQTKPVDVYIVVSEAEGAVKANIERKQRDATRMTDELIGYTKEFLKNDLHATENQTIAYFAFEDMEVPEWLITQTE